MFHSQSFDEGQGLLEYVLVLVLIAIVVVVALSLFGETLAGYYDSGISKLLEYF